VTGPLTFAVTGAILIEAICWAWCLRRFRKPRLFILWVLGMHLITFPDFVGLLHFLDALRLAVAVSPRRSKADQMRRRWAKHRSIQNLVAARDVNSLSSAPVGVSREAVAAVWLANEYYVQKRSRYSIRR
jgi:hypothetical protein